MAKVEKTVILNVDSKKATKGLKDLEKGIDGVNKEVKETAASTEAIGGTLDQVTGGAVTKFTKFKKTLTGVTGGFKTMRGAIISTGLGALVIIIGSLIAAFKGSEEGQNKFAKIMSVIGALTGNLVDLLADFGEGIINAFENPKQAITDFANLIKDNIVTRFEGLINLIPNLGRAVEQLFKGNFKEAGKIAADSVGKVVLGVDSVTDAVKNATNSLKEFTAEQIREGKAAAAVADMRAKADKIERNLIVQRSKLESEIAQLRLKSRQEEQFSAEERKQALLDAQKLEDTLLDKETEFLELRRDAQIQENTFSRSNKENLTKEAEAIAAVNRQVAARANAARQVQREVNTISKQIEAQNKADAAEEKAIQDKKIADEKLRTDAIEKIQEDFRQKQKDKDAETELEKINLEEERKLAELERLGATEEQKQSIIDFYNGKRLDNKIALDKAEVEIDKNTAKAKQENLAKVGNALSSFSEIAGKETAAGKALAIASTLIQTYQSAQSSYASLAGIPIVGPALGVAAAGAAVFAGMKQIQNIKKTKVPKGGGGGGASAGGASVGAAPAPPSFNVVGASETSVLADTVAEQTNEPVQAYVVSNDVTTAQSLENNIVEGATL